MVHVFGLSYDLNAKIEVLFTDTEGPLKTDCILSCLLKFRGVSESAALRLAKLWNFAQTVLSSPVSAITYFKKVVKLLRSSWSYSFIGRSWH